MRKSKKKQASENTQGVNMLESSDGVEYSLPSVSGAMNVTEGGDVLNEIVEMFDEPLLQVKKAAKKVAKKPAKNVRKPAKVTRNINVNIQLRT